MRSRSKIKDYLNKFDNIAQYYNFLIDRTKQNEYVGITNEWLIDNYYILVEYEENFLNDKSLRKKIKKNSNLFELVKTILEKFNYNIYIKEIFEEINKYQHENDYYFTYEEISVLNNILYIVFTYKINELTKLEKKRYDNKQKIKKLLLGKNINEVKLKNLLPDKYDPNDNENYIFELINQIRESGSKSNTIFESIDIYLKVHNIITKDLLNNEYQIKLDNNIIISTIFNNIKELEKLSDNDIFKAICVTESKLLKDKIYNSMTMETKSLYRNQISKMAKKENTTEINLVENLLTKAKNENSHIGLYLFKKHNYNIKFDFYLIFINLLTIIIDLLICPYLTNYKFLNFIILYIPINQIIIEVTNTIVNKFTTPKPLPKLNFEDGIPDDCKTMVVIPTIVGDKQKVEKMFNTLETFYLINKSKNLYFTLLGDCKAYDKKNYPKDEEIKLAGLECCKKLNEKYNKNIFQFIYRRRVWNDSEDSFLGYERKRGALLHFNHLLLNKMTQKDINKYIYCHTFDNFNEKIKYVITLDADTKLVLNTALNLVGAMAHPLNKPVLNDTRTRVIDGYALMQPKVSVDIESTNKSLYTQIFSDIGGFDTYTQVVPNFYQDQFNEGSFVGKGIYDLEIFDELLFDKFPENLILSHDLLEGNYTRCSFVSDIELIDDFPQGFLNDASRQHRWARGDTQIIRWISKYVKNKENKKVYNPISRLGKWKILDNILRMFKYPCLLFIILLSFISNKVNPSLWFLFVILSIALSILLFIDSKLKERKKKDVEKAYNKDLLYGGKSLLFRSYIIFSLIPYYTKMYMDAFFKTIFRLTISKKHLLSWITAEDAEKFISNDISNYIKNFIFNIFIGVVLIILSFISKVPLGFVLGIIFIIAPFILQSVSKPLAKKNIELSEDEVIELYELASKTWKFFSDNLTEENNYLIPDNYQENRSGKINYVTSPTNIGFSLTTIIGAVELNLISEDDAINLIAKIITSIESLEKWNGHLYNWYDIKSKEVLYPHFISTVDSGNLVGCLMITNSFLINKGNALLARRVNELIKKTDFKKLYTKSKVFSIGYDVYEGKLSPYKYNKFASESRLASFVAIAKGDVTPKHWLALDKTLTIHNKRKGLLSWSGTSFEYYMPLLFMKNYKNTLLDESYKFAHYCQKEYIENINKQMPWGISETAYSELDNSQNYKYKTFHTPALKAKFDKENRVVLSPYASIMAASLYPKEIIDNIHKFKKLDMEDKYGLYESYDYDNKVPVKAYFSHHQGMLFAGLVNYLKSNILQDYFHNDIRVQTYDILLKEKIQIKTVINIKIEKYKKYNYNKLAIENDIRAINDIRDMPEISVLSNKKYCLLMNERGNSFSRYREIQLNRYRKITEQDYGMFMYIKDQNKNIWSNTYAPINKLPKMYKCVFASDLIKYIREDNDVITKTEIIVCKDHHAEIRKISFTNKSNSDKVLELTSYTEPTITQNITDVSHKTFNSMFLKTVFDEKTNTLITYRENRENTKEKSYYFNRLIIENPIEDYQYETSRDYFIGRNNNSSNPEALNKKLTNTINANIEPIMSLRNKIVLKANQTEDIYLICGFARSIEQINDTVYSYDNVDKIIKAFKVSNLMNIVKNRKLGIKGKELRLFNIMLNYLYQTTKIMMNDERKELLAKNSLTQSCLWKFGISGDRPIVLLDIKDIGDMSTLYEILKCFEYFKLNSIFIDLVIINSEKNQSRKIINNEILYEKYRMYSSNNFSHIPGEIYIINKDEINDDEYTLLNVVARLKFIIDNHQSLDELINYLQYKNKKSDLIQIQEQDNLKRIGNYNLKLKNNYGGFTQNGHEFVITNKNTPMPWCNIIANNNIGSVITNNGCGFTYCYNSGEFKLTSWTNDVITNDKSEGIKVNNEMFDPTICKHGFGYTQFISNTKEYDQELTEFVALNDNVKLFIFKIKNNLDKKQKLSIEFWINPNLGNFEEKTSRYILTEFRKNENYLQMRNVYNINFSDTLVYMSSSEKITKFIDNKILVKSIFNDIELNPFEEKTIVYQLGCNKNIKENEKLIEKYKNIQVSNNELKKVKNKWEKELNTIQIETPDDSFNTIMNGWYLYQTKVSRIMARTGFYQVSGAFGYRDQLQDSMNIASINPEISRKQILINASHQFVEGDVLHWWHEDNHFGLRSKYKDDFLWLVYATLEYINVTNDYKILNEEVPFVMGPNLNEYQNELGMNFEYSKETKPLLEHLKLSLNLSMNNLGSHGLPLMGGGDWNDGMNKVGIKGKGESVWLGFFLYNIIEKFVKLPDIEKNKYIKFNEELKKSLNENAWDKEYYLRAYFDNGDKLGSIDNKECKIDLISQSFSILSDVIPKNRINSVIDSVEKYLVDKENKLIKLLQPPFKGNENDPGYIKCYPEGIRENGGQYTHATSWYIQALIKLGYIDRAFEYFQMINPINRSLDNINRYKVEPYVIAADIYSANNLEGRGGWTWYTGSSGWFYRVGLIDILGFKLHGNTLEIKPNIPFDEYKIKYIYKSTTYNIFYNKKNKKLKYDSKYVNEIKLIDDGKIHTIIVGDNK